MRKGCRSSSAAEASSGEPGFQPLVTGPASVLAPGTLSRSWPSRAFGRDPSSSLPPRPSRQHSAATAYIPSPVKPQLKSPGILSSSGLFCTAGSTAS